MLPRPLSCHRGTTSVEREEKGPTFKDEGGEGREEKGRKGREGIVPGPPTFQNLPSPICW